MVNQEILKNIAKFVPGILLSAGIIGTLLVVIAKKYIDEYSSRIAKLESRMDIGHDLIVICRLDIKELQVNQENQKEICKREHNHA